MKSCSPLETLLILKSGIAVISGDFTENWVADKYILGIKCSQYI